MYNINNPSNWSWSKAFAEVEKSVNETEMYQQLSMIITNNENTLWKDLSEDQKDECYHLIDQVI
jgi:TRAP-type C4-dicarboxylate transport system substrate-binding protein